MLATGWKKAITKSGRSQRSLAQALSVNLVEMSMVVQGRAFLTPDKFERACELLSCRPTDLYTEDAVTLMYGIGERETEALPRKDKYVHVRLATDVRYLVDKVAEDEHMNRSQAANAIIRRAFETRRIEA